MISKVTDYLKSITEKKLLKAIEKNDLNTVKKHLDNGIDINTTRIKGYTLLMLASIYGHLEIVKHLVENGAELDIIGKDDMTALACAVQRDKYYVADYLLYKGSDVTKGVIYNDTISNYASRMFNESMVELFENHHKNLAIKAEIAKKEQIENKKIERSNQIKAHKEAILTMMPDEILSPSNTKMLQEISDKSMLAEVFVGLDYKRQNALLVACWDEISADDELNQKIQQTMQESLNKEQSGKIDVPQINLFNRLSIAKTNA